VVSKTDDNRSDADVLRAADIIPPFAGAAGQPPRLPTQVGAAGRKAPPRKDTAGGKAPPQPQKESFCEDLAEHPVSQRPGSVESASAAAGGGAHEPGAIPKFDLAEELMAGQRTASAARRKAPGRKGTATNNGERPRSIEYARKALSQELSQQQLIIADIVARDIERLCRGDVSSAISRIKLQIAK